MATWLDHPDKIYFSISEVAAGLGVNASLLRFWEKEFSLQHRKNSRGNRIYTREDISRLEKIHELVKERGMTLQGAKSHLEKTGSGERGKEELLESLKKIRSFLADLKHELDQ